MSTPSQAAAMVVVERVTTSLTWMCSMRTRTMKCCMMKIWLKCSGNSPPSSTNMAPLFDFISIFEYMSSRGKKRCLKLDFFIHTFHNSKQKRIYIDDEPKRTSGAKNSYLFTPRRHPPPRPHSCRLRWPPRRRRYRWGCCTGAKWLCSGPS